MLVEFTDKANTESFNGLPRKVTHNAACMRYTVAACVPP